MDLPPALHDALLFTVAGALFAMVMMRWKRDQRQSMLQMLILLVIGVSGLLALNQFGANIATTMLGSALREVGLLLAAFGFIRIFLVFVFQGVFARMALPRILGDVLFAFSLLTYTVYRMYAVGFDFSTIAITSTVIGGGVALSLKEALANPLGRGRHSTRQPLPHRRLDTYRGGNGAGGQHSLAVHVARDQRRRDA